MEGTPPNDSAGEGTRQTIKMSDISESDSETKRKVDKNSYINTSFMNDAQIDASAYDQDFSRRNSSGHVPNASYENTSPVLNIQADSIYDKPT